MRVLQCLVSGMEASGLPEGGQEGACCLVLRLVLPLTCQHSTQSNISASQESFLDDDKDGGKRHWPHWTGKESKNSARPLAEVINPPPRGGSATDTSHRTPPPLP